MEIKPLGCPWCGEIPNEYKTPHGAYYLECENYACPVQPQSQAFRTREKLIRRWNDWGNAGTNAQT